MHRNRSVSAHSFAMVPRADIPRSSFKIESSYKTTFDAGYLVPFYVEEVLPGDSFSLKATLFARLATPITPFIDNLYLDTFFFFVPNRLVWENWQRFMGERPNPGDSIDFLVPTLDLTQGATPTSLFDYFGIPNSGQVTGTLEVNALPARAYNLIWNEWFRDQNLQAAVPVPKDDGPDDEADYTLLRRGKRHDYFTSCLPWTQKGSPVSLPLGTTAPVVTYGDGVPTFRFDTEITQLQSKANDDDVRTTFNTPSGAFMSWENPKLYADLSAATAATINQIRQAFQIQKLLERDARGGTRYTELVRSHFGVISPDARLQRPEYLGGGSVPVTVQEVAQTALGDTTAGDPALGWVTGKGKALAYGHGFTQSFTEHGYVIGLLCVRADLNYQQGLNKIWSRRTRYDFYWPAFAHLGEQAVYNREIYAQGTAQDAEVFGYQERYAEYRYKPSLVTGMLNSRYGESLDLWHLAQEFSTLPTLNATFIEERPPVDRVIATTEQTGQQFVLDCLLSNRAARPLPMYGVPGLVDHF